MKSIEEIMYDLKAYFARVNAEGIDGADYVDASFMKTEDEDGRRETLYVVFFNGEDRVRALNVNFTTGEESDLT